MKKSLPVFILAFSCLLFSCHKEDLQSPDTVSSSPKTSNYRFGVEVGGSTGGVDFKCQSCVMTYPYASDNIRTSAIFNESDILVAYDPGTSTCGSIPQDIKVWYTDEHPLCLGVRQVIVKSKGKTDITDYPNIIPATSAASSGKIDIASGLTSQIGATDQKGDNTGNDVSVDGGRPLWPALFVTDLNPGGDGNIDFLSRSGDWQFNGTAIPPTNVYGMWKYAVRTVDKTKTPNVVTINMDSDPKKSNRWDLANGYAPPAGTYNEKYGALVTWNVQTLIDAGVFYHKHYYRLQFMVHDGDQNKTGGDVGEGCSTIYIP
jgi:hypothetical protein